MTNEDREALIDWCTDSGMSPEWTEVAVRCIEWMENIIDSNINDLTGEPMYDDSEKALKEAQFILRCIEYFIAN